MSLPDDKNGSVSGWFTRSCDEGCGLAIVYVFAASDNDVDSPIPWRHFCAAT